MNCSVPIEQEQAKEELNQHADQLIEDLYGRKHTNDDSVDDRNDNKPSDPVVLSEAQEIGRK